MKQWAEFSQWVFFSLGCVSLGFICADKLFFAIIIMIFFLMAAIKIKD